MILMFCHSLVFLGENHTGCVYDFKHWESLFHSQGLEEDAGLGSV